MASMNYFLNNPKGASFKENRLMTTAHDALRTTSIFRFSTYENNLNFLNQIKTRIKWPVTLKLIYLDMHIHMDSCETLKKHTFSKPIIVIDWCEKKVYKQW